MLIQPSPGPAVDVGVEIFNGFPAHSTQVVKHRAQGIDMRLPHDETDGQGITADRFDNWPEFLVAGV